MADRFANLTPAQRTAPDPEGGWAGADLADDELVDDAHIAADPTSQVLEPIPGEVAGA